MIHSSVKKVCMRSLATRKYRTRVDIELRIVCVSDLLIAEIKRIIKSSEIMKYNKPKLRTFS
jgi:hypothetical protein